MSTRAPTAIPGLAAMGAIAVYAVREALRNRLLALVVVFLVAAFAAAAFVAEVAITETAEVRAGFLGAVLRVCAVFTVSLFVITSIVREVNDKVVELVLSHAVPRAAYALGKLAGFSVICAVVALACGACLALTAPVLPVAVWSLSLLCELLIVTALCLLCLFTFSQVTVAMSAVIAFYVLARAMAAFRLIAESPLLPSSGLGQRAMETGVETLAFVLPSLERFTRSEWLVHGVTGWSELATVLVQTLIYVALLGAAGLFDLYRRNL